MDVFWGPMYRWGFPSWLHFFILPGTQKVCNLCSRPVIHHCSQMTSMASHLKSWLNCRAAKWFLSTSPACSQPWRSWVPSTPAFQAKSHLYPTKETLIRRAAFLLPSAATGAETTVSRPVVTFGWLCWKDTSIFLSQWHRDLFPSRGQPLSRPDASF